MGSLVSELQKDWNYPLIELGLPEKIVSCILAMAAPQEEGGQDVLIWGLTNQGQYSTMSRLNFQMGRSMRNDLNSRINLEIEGTTKDQSVFMVGGASKADDDCISCKAAFDCQCKLFKHMPR